MTNKHGLKIKHKNMIRLLKDLYDKRSFQERKLVSINEKIYRLEKAKNNCAEQIRGIDKNVKSTK